MWCSGVLGAGLSMHPASLNGACWAATRQLRMVRNECRGERLREGNANVAQLQHQAALAVSGWHGRIPLERDWMVMHSAVGPLQQVQTCCRSLQHRQNTEEATFLCAVCCHAV